MVLLSTARAHWLRMQCALWFVFYCFYWVQFVGWCIERVTLHAIDNIKLTLTYFDNSVKSPTEYIYIYICIYTHTHSHAHTHIPTHVCVFIENGWIRRGQGIPSKTNVDVEHSSITLDVTTRSFSHFADEEFLSSGKVYQFASFSFRFYGNNHFSHQNYSVSILAATNTCEMFTYSSSAPLRIVLGRRWNGVEM